MGPGGILPQSRSLVTSIACYGSNMEFEIVNTCEHCVCHRACCGHERHDCWIDSAFHVSNGNFVSCGDVGLDSANSQMHSWCVDTWGSSGERCLAKRLLDSWMCSFPIVSLRMIETTLLQYGCSWFFVENIFRPTVASLQDPWLTPLILKWNFKAVICNSVISACENLGLEYAQLFS